MPCNKFSEGRGHKFKSVFGYGGLTVKQVTRGGGGAAKKPEDSGYEIGQILEKGKSPGNEFVSDVQCHVKCNFYSLLNSPRSILLFHTPPSMLLIHTSYKANGITTNDLR